MVEKVHPENLKEVNSFQITEEVKSFVTTLASDVEQERTNRSFWEQTIDKLRRLRYGIREVKTHPWPKCANFSLPLIDTHINTLKPSYINLAFGVSPIVTFEPYGGEDVEPARRRELLFDWRMRTQVKFFQPYAYGVDKLLEQGAVVFKTIWRYQTRHYSEFLDIEDFDREVVAVLYSPSVTDADLFNIIQEHLKIDLSFEENVKAIQDVIVGFRSGETSFELQLIEIAENRPQVIARDLRDDITIPIETLIYEDNLDDALFVDDRIWMTRNDLKKAMADGKYEEYPDTEIDSWVTKVDNADRTSVHNLVGQDEIILIHETCTWKDIDEDGIKERVIVTWPDASPSMVLRMIECPYDHGQSPYTLVKRELNDFGVYSSRGICALDEDYQVGVSTAFNQAVDNGTIVNSPTLIKRRNSTSNVRNKRYIPGEVLEANDPQRDIVISQQPNLSQGILFQQAQYIKSWADARIGGLTSGTSSENNLPGTREGGKKTAREVASIENSIAQVQSLDLQVFQQQMARVYYQIDALYWQFGDDEAEFAVTGEAPVKVTRSEIQGRFNIVPNGRLDNTNPQLRAQKALVLKEIYTGVPYIRQYELDKLFLNDFDARMASKILMSQEEIAQQQAQQAQAQQQAKQQMVSEQVQLRNLEDAMDVKKASALEAIGAQATANVS